MEDNEKAIGVLDSGIGGLSVLKELMRLMPNENYIYFGDSENAPYGTKTAEEVRELTSQIVETLLDKGVKGIVIACNTATSAAAKSLRKKYEGIPIVGIEPALKPAVIHNKGGRIIVMATPMTLKERKFHDLLEHYEEDADIILMPCGRLMEFVEHGILNGPVLKQYLEEKFHPYLDKQIDAVVLGCTHYPFLKDAIYGVVGMQAEIIDGSIGTAKEVRRQLQKAGLLAGEDHKGKIEILNSGHSKELLALSWKLLET